VSQENSEVVRQVVEWTHSDDIDDRMDRGLALWDPNCEFTSVMAEVEPQTYRGHDGLRRYGSSDFPRCGLRSARALPGWADQVRMVLAAHRQGPNDDPRAPGVRPAVGDSDAAR
jgi:hypothetical protein